MTLGEKLKEARKQAGISQEELSEKLGVSRSAVAKWETDGGIPDVDNLRVISKLLNVSIDYLLDDGEITDELVMREPYNLSDYGKGIRKTKKDRVIYEKFPDSEIYTLLAEQKLTKSEKIADNAIGLLTNAPFGIPQLINSLKNLDKEFYLIEKDGKQFLVIVTDEFIEIHRLAKRINDKKFEIGNIKFTRCAYEVKRYEKKNS